MNPTNMLADIRYALRQLRNSPGFTFTAAFTLAVAIGANTAVFTLVHDILLRQLPFQDAERIYNLNGYASLGFDLGSKGSQPFREGMQSLSSVEAASIYNIASANFSINGMAPLRLQAAEVSAQFLNTLGVAPVLGNGFSEAEDTPGEDHVVLISYRLWQGSFAGSREVIGRTLHLNSFAFTIIGVLPQRMDFPSRADVWTPTIFDNHTFLREGGAFMPSAIVRLRRGTSVEQALAELNARALSVRHGKALAEDERPQLNGVAAELTRSIRSSLYMLSGAVAFVLLIACANLASLMLVRTAERGTALAVRAALGASRSRLMRQQLVESVLIALFGAMIGILFAHGALRVLYVFRPAVLTQFPRPAIESGVLAFTMALSIATGLLFGMMPAWIAAHQSPETVLKAGAWRTNPTRNRLRQFLVIFEIALSLVLLVGAGLLLRTIYSLNHVPLGFDVQHRLSFTVSLHGAPYDFSDSPAGQKPASSIAAIEHDPSTRSMDSFYTRALSRLSRLPGVMHVAMINDLPLNIGADMLFPIRNSGGVVSAAPRVASSGYFETMGIRLLEGRDFSAQDTGDSGRVVIVTKNLADKLWPGKDAIGQQLHCAWFCEPSATVIGVVAPAHVYGPRPDAQQEFYLSYAQVRWPSATFVLQTQSNPNGLIEEVRQVIAEIDPRQPVYNIESMQERLDDKESLERFQVFALSVFAAVSIAMAIVGLYGVISYSVAQRTREIGLRMALGAPRPRIVRAFLQEGILLLAAGCTMGGAAGLYLSRLLSATLYGVKPGDPWTLLAVTILFWLVATLASWVPARRAASVDPIQALRTE